MSRVAAIILAAGRGSRFGEAPKLLAPLEGRPLVRHVTEAVLASRVRPVLVVVGHKAGEVEAALHGLDLQIISNPDFAEGLSTSLKAGFAALPAEADGALVLLGDMPRIGPRLIERLWNGWVEAGSPAAAIPTCGGRRGNPVLLSRQLAGEIRDLKGDAGAGRMLRGRADVIEVPVEDPAILLDIDTREALADLSDNAGPGPLSAGF